MITTFVHHPEHSLSSPITIDGDASRELCTQLVKLAQTIESSSVKRCERCQVILGNPGDIEHVAKMVTVRGHTVGAIGIRPDRRFIESAIIRLLRLTR